MLVVRFLSRIIFHWLSPFLEVGFSRPLEATGMSKSVNPFEVLMTTCTDLWELPEPQLTSAIADETEKNFYSRCPPEKRPRFMNKETQNTILDTSLVLPSKDTAGDAENEKQEYETDMEKVSMSHSLIFDKPI